MYHCLAQAGMTPGDLRIDPRRDFACPIGVEDHLSRCRNDIRIVATFHLQGFYSRGFDLVLFQFNELVLMIVMITVLLFVLLML